MSPHPAELVHKGVHILDIDGNIGGWWEYEKKKKKN
jgi:hypothetical protein